MCRRASGAWDEHSEPAGQRNINASPRAIERGLRPRFRHVRCPGNTAPGGQMGWLRGFAGIRSARPRPRVPQGIAPVVIKSVAADTTRGERWTTSTESGSSPPSAGVNAAFAVGALGVQTRVFVCGTHPSWDQFPRARNNAQARVTRSTMGARHGIRRALLVPSWIISNAMNAIAFDTLKFAKRLKEAGFTEQQAEALADAEAEFIEQNLATKRDIADVKRDIKELEVTLRNEIKRLDVKMEQIRSDLARDLKDLEYRMTIKLGTLMVVAVGAMATLVKVL